MIHSEWNGIRPNIQNLPFLKHLQKLEVQQKQRQNRNFTNQGQIVYIEKILQNKINDGKKRIFALILCPYLVNVKKLTLDESEKILVEYFDGVISKSMITYKLNEVYKKGILPYSLKNMQDNDRDLFNIILESGVLEK